MAPQLYACKPAVAYSYHESALRLSLCHLPTVRGLTVVGHWPYSRRVMTNPLTAERVRAALEEAGGSPTKAARILGCSRTTVYDWMRKHSIEIARVVR